MCLVNAATHVGKRGEISQPRQLGALQPPVPIRQLVLRVQQRWYRSRGASLTAQKRSNGLASLS